MSVYGRAALTRGEVLGVAQILADNWLNIREYCKHQGVDRGTFVRRAAAVGVCLQLEVRRLRVQTVVDRHYHQTPDRTIEACALEYGFVSPSSFFVMRRTLERRYGIRCTPTEPHP